MNDRQAALSAPGVWRAPLHGQPLAGQPLRRFGSRIPDKQTLIEEVAAWQDSRKQNHTKAGWQFTIADAHVKLKRLYPAI